MAVSDILGFTIPVPGQENAIDRIVDALLALDAAFSPARARVYHNANQSISNAALTALSFNSERFDSASLHSTSSNTSRLTAPVVGLYLITASVAFDSNATGIRSLRFRLNGSTYIANKQVNAVSGGFDAMLAISTLYQLSASDYVELVVFQNSGGSLNVQSQANYSPEFAMEKVG